MSALKTLSVLVFLVIVSCITHAQIIEKRTIGLELARKIAAIAETEAAKNNWNVAISIVDDGGNLIYFGKMDNTQTGSIEVSIQKAKTAINFKRSTKVYEDMVAAGRNAILTVPGVLPIEGGVPFVINGQFIGAIGISGAKSTEDGVIAKVALDFFANQFEKNK